MMGVLGLLTWTLRVRWTRVVAPLGPLWAELLARAVAAKMWGSQCNEAMCECRVGWEMLRAACSLRGCDGKLRRTRIDGGY